MFWDNSNIKRFAEKIGQKKPAAMAVMKGSASYPNIRGTVSFYKTMRGTLVVSEIYGLPYKEGPCSPEVYGFHIHEGNRCTGNAEDPFADAGEHYNPKHCPHPQHAGDLPPLFGNDGYAWSAVLTNRFDVDMIIGKTVIIHRDPDNFTTQPSGASGEKIACGVIRPF